MFVESCTRFMGMSTLSTDLYRRPTFKCLPCAGLPLDAVPDDVADPAEGADAARAPDAALPDHGPRDEVPGRGDLHVARVPGEHRGVLRPEH